MMSFERGLCSPFGDVSLVQEKDCVSYTRKENELVVYLVCSFLLVFEILVHCVKLEGFSAF